MIPEFALRLIFGLSSIWCLAPRREVTSGFFRIQMLLSLGLSVLVAVTANQFRGEFSGRPNLLQGLVFGTGLILAFLSFAGSVSWTLERRRGGMVFSTLILLASLAGISLSLLAVMPTSPARLVLVGLNSVSSGWWLGATTAAMLLGHWYLTATGMPLSPMLNYTRFAIGATALRAGVAGILFLAGSQDSPGNWPLLVLRWGGLAASFLLGVMTLRILKYRNTQSATGVLYASTVLVFMSEMAASLLASSQAQ